MKRIVLSILFFLLINSTYSFAIDECRQHTFDGFAESCPMLNVDAVALEDEAFEIELTPPEGHSFSLSTVYIMNNGEWQPHTLSDVDGPWISERTLRTIDPQESNLEVGFYYLVSWDVTWDFEEGCYKGPGLDQCETGQWRITTFTVEARNQEPPPPPPPASGETPENFTISFIGDVGLKETSKEVLRLAKRESDLLMVAGDFDYDGDPEAWEEQLNETVDEVGSNGEIIKFPVFQVIGNHDEDDFFGSGNYQEYMEERMNDLNIPWQGDLGVKSTIYYNGIFIVQTAPKLGPEEREDYGNYIAEQFGADDSIWRISTWHVVQREMSVGVKNNEAGWEVYEESRKAGAIVTTGHEHNYSRSHTMSSFVDQEVAHTSNTITLRADDPDTQGVDEGTSFVSVSGLGGQSIRNQEKFGDWWASVYTKDDDAVPGVLFGVFNYQGDPTMAYFYFKNIDGEIIDEFFVRSDVGGGR